MSARGRRILELNKALTEAEDRSGSRQAEVAALRSRVAELEATVKRLESQAADAQKIIRDVEETSARLESELERYQESDKIRSLARAGKLALA